MVIEQIWVLNFEIYLTPSRALGFENPNPQILEERETEGERVERVTN